MKRGTRLSLENKNVMMKIKIKLLKIAEKEGKNESGKVLGRETLCIFL